jgi:ABC-2 type transport system ATP-binding protein
MSAAIVVGDLTRAFGRRTVLCGVSFEVRRGEVFALAGANGSGKSTLIEILATLLAPTAGRAIVHGFDTVREPWAARLLIGYCPSNLQSFYPRLSGRRNLEFFAALYGVDPRASRKRVDSLIESVGLSEAGRDRVERYSDGMKARLCIARALLTDAPVLLLDEPTKSLDPEGREAMRKLILGSARSSGPRSVVWVTHDLDEAAAVSDRLGVLEGGALRVVAARDARRMSYPAAVHA